MAPGIDSVSQDTNCVAWHGARDRYRLRGVSVVALVSFGMSPSLQVICLEGGEFCLFSSPLNHLCLDCVCPAASVQFMFLDVE